MRSVFAKRNFPCDADNGVARKVRQGLFCEGWRCVRDTPVTSLKLREFAVIAKRRNRGKTPNAIIAWENGLDSLFKQGRVFKGMVQTDPVFPFMVNRQASRKSLCKLFLSGWLFFWVRGGRGGGGLKQVDLSFCVFPCFALFGGPKIPCPI